MFCLPESHPRDISHTCWLAFAVGSFFKCYCMIACKNGTAVGVHSHCSTNQDLQPPGPQVTPKNSDQLSLANPRDAQHHGKRAANE